MEKKKEQEPRTLEQLTNDIDLLSNTARDGVTGLGEETVPWKKHHRLAALAKRLEEEAQGIRYDLELLYPVMALSVDIEPHRCSVCHVMLENLSEEECLKCDDPTAYLSYRDPTEVTESDEQ